ncbi:amidohydrolase family protein [Haloferacaceae archaeon DSL9]
MATLITNTTLVTVAGGDGDANSPESADGAGGLGIVDDGAVGWRNGALTDVGPASDVDERDYDAVIDASGCLTLPGLINAHAHMPQTLLRGAAQDVPEIEWMNDALGPFASRLTDGDRIAGARLGALEAIRSGATTICEYATRAGDLVEAVYRPLGVRAVATETINEVPRDRSGFGPRERYPFDAEQGRAALERADALFDRYREESLVTPMYGPQALDMVSSELLAAIEERSRRHDRRVHMHVAQGEREALQIAERYGEDESTVSVLESRDMLSNRLIAVHLHGATTAERRRLVEAGVGMVGCPSSIVAIDGIVPPIAEYRQHGGTAALGTDQAPGPGGHDVLREVRTAALCSKTAERDPTALRAWEALRLVTIDAARVLGLETEVGSLEVGKRADVVTVDCSSLGVAPTVRTPFHTAIPNLVYGASGADVRDVFVDGRPLLRRGQFVDADPEAAIAAASDRAVRIFADAESAWRSAGSALVDAVDNGSL